MSNISNYLKVRSTFFNPDPNNFYILHFYRFLKSLQKYGFSYLFHFPYNLLDEKIKSSVMSSTISHSLDIVDCQCYTNIEHVILSWYSHELDLIQIDTLAKKKYFIEYLIIPTGGTCLLLSLFMMFVDIDYHYLDPLFYQMFEMR